jgi:hypothetical protein
MEIEKENAMNKTTYTSFAILSIFVLTLSACGFVPVFGSGRLISETRPVSGYDTISVSGAGELVLIQDGSESLTVETDDNMMPYLVAEVRGSTLHLYLRSNGMNNLQPSELVFTVHVRELAAVSTSGTWDVRAQEIETDDLLISTSGTGDVNIAALTATSLSVDISGTATVVVAGTAVSQSLDFSGTVEYAAGELQSKTTVVDVSGTGDVIVWVTDSLSVDISGTGSVRYYGSPQTDIQTSGSASVQRVGDK